MKFARSSGPDNGTLEKPGVTMHRIGPGHRITVAIVAPHGPGRSAWVAEESLCRRHNPWTSQLTGGDRGAGAVNKFGSSAHRP